MKKQNLISVERFCSYYEIPDSFIHELVEYELIKVIQEKEKRFIDFNSVSQIEKYIRLHFDLNVNFEGLDIITNLITQLEEAQEEIKKLKAQINLYRLD